MLFQKNGRQTHKDCKHDIGRLIPGGYFFQIKTHMHDHPAFQNMDGRKQIVAGIGLVDHSRQAVKDPGAGDLRAKGCRREHKKYDHRGKLGKQVRHKNPEKDSAVLVCCLDVAEYPMGIRQHIYDNERSHQRDFAVYGQRQIIVLSSFVDQTYPPVSKGVQHDQKQERPASVFFGYQTDPFFFFIVIQ